METSLRTESLLIESTDSMINAEDVLQGTPTSSLFSILCTVCNIDNVGVAKSC